MSLMVCRLQAFQTLPAAAALERSPGGAAEGKLQYMQLALDDVFPRSSEDDTDYMQYYQ